MSATSPQPQQRLPRWLRGTLSTIAIPVAWIWRFLGGSLGRFVAPERYDHGLVIVLPGVESESFLNHSIVWGLSDGGWKGAIEIYDWTTTIAVLFPFHLRTWKRNLRQARLIARRIAAYQASHPSQPVHLIGHSGGGAMAILALEALPADHRVTSAILLGPALSPGYSLADALDRTERGIWSFWSLLDVIFLGAGTVLLGTIDAKWCPAAGMTGFRVPSRANRKVLAAYLEKLHQVHFSWRMISAFNLGGHFGWTNRVFVEEWVAPLVKQLSVVS